jgi:uncharacterized membrane protein
MKPRLWLNATLLAVALIGYPIAMHVLLTSQQWPATTLVMSLLPLAVAPMGLFKTGHLKLGVLSVALSAVLLWLFWNTLLNRQDWIYLMQNVGMQTMMAWIFGRTLLPPHEALISQIARHIHGADFTPAIAAYTRQATWAWVFFFVAMVVISVVLFAAAPLSAWSFFVNVLYLPLLALMFVLEYAARRYCLRNIEHLSIIKGISLYWEKRTSAAGKP